VLAADIHAYRFNSDAFAFERFENEVVVLNVVEGVYYSFGGAAPLAWPYITAQHTGTIIASVLAPKYGVQADTLFHDLSEFIQRLVYEKILLAAPENISDIDPSQLPSSTEYPGFLFERHADMEDLLTLDPIHDVDPQKGWPNI
jgi:hypothetical protein